MKTYFASADGPGDWRQIDEAGAKHIMITAPEHFGHEARVLDLGRRYRVFADSGAFGAHTRGRPVEIGVLSDWLLKTREAFEAYAGLDVIGDFKATVKNHAELKALGLDPMPVHHLARPAYPIGHLEGLAEQYDWIGVGGLVGPDFSWEEKEDFLRGVFAVVGRHYKVGRQVRTHGFGVSAARLLENFPFYSVDSSIWKAGGSHSLILNFDGTRLKQIMYRDRKAADFVDTSLLDDGDHKAYHERNVHNVREILKHETFLTDLWASRGVVWEN